MPSSSVGRTGPPSVLGLLGFRAADGNGFTVVTTDPEFLRLLAARQGVEPTDDDLEAVRGFLDAILPELERLEATLEPEDA